MKKRFEWCVSDPAYIAYHDEEWGVPVHDDRLLFEFLILEGAQAGLSWLTILKKRDNYREAFHGYPLPHPTANEPVPSGSADQAERDHPLLVQC